jgi:rhodanese-related sulfurtransferase
VRIAHTNTDFAIWVGTLLHPSTNILLVTPEGKERESIERLARVGFHNVIGYLEGGFPSWKTGEDQWGYAYKVDSFERVRLSEASDLQALVDDEDVVLVDFRTGHEFDCPTNGHVKGAIKMPLGELPARLAELDATKRYVTYCSGGFRSTIGVGFMLHKGLKVVRRVLCEVRRLSVHDHVCFCVCRPISMGGTREPFCLWPSRLRPLRQSDESPHRRARTSSYSTVQDYSRFRVSFHNDYVCMY